jgi:hypothetical protein
MELRLPWYSMDFDAEDLQRQVVGLGLAVAFLGVAVEESSSLGDWKRGPRGAGLSLFKILYGGKMKVVDECKGEISLGLWCSRLDC